MNNQPTREDNDTVRFSCFWPDPILGANSRAHWRVKAKATKAARGLAHTMARLARIRTIEGAPFYNVECSFCPPDKRRRDAQNFPHLAKAYIDGIADALGVDDNIFNVTWVNCEPGLGLIGFAVTPTGKRETMH